MVSPALLQEAAQRKAEFAALAAQWHADTDMLSSPSRITSHPAYLQIIEMGEAAIPLILDDLQQRGGNWYAALRALARTSPVPARSRGDVSAMTEAWITWGSEQGYIA